jgi:hypothetical protein
MRRFLARRPSPAMVVALVALFVALGGASYAAFKLPKNSVGTPQLKKGAVTGAKVKSGSLLASNFKAGQLPAGPKGAQGAKGEQGKDGEKGPQGPGATTLTYDAAASASPTPTVVGTVLGVTFSAECSIPGAGEAETKLFVLPSDGSLRWDVGTEVSDNSTNEGRSTSINLPAGTVLAPTQIAGAAATSGGSQSDHNSQIVELAPARGYLNIHTTASTQSSTQTCHVSVMAFPSG